MKIHLRPLSYALLVSAFLSLSSSVVFYIGEIDRGINDIGTIYSSSILLFLSVFLVVTVGMYLFFGAWMIEETKKKGFWFYVRKFFVWRAIIRLVIGGIAGFLLLSFGLIQYMNDFYPIHISIVLGLLIAFVIVLPIFLIFYKLYQQKKAFRKEIEEHFGKKLT